MDHVRFPQVWGEVAMVMAGEPYLRSRVAGLEQVVVRGRDGEILFQG